MAIESNAPDLVESELDQPTFLETVPWPWHLAAWSQFAQLCTQQRLPHALLLAGPAGLGKHSLALRMAQLVACQSPRGESEQMRPCGECSACVQLRVGSYPGFKYLSVAEKAQAIKIDQVREAIDLVGQTFEGWRIIIIQQAERMTVAAQNALLKSLEEPGKQVLFLLLSSQPGSVLPTIRSRCQLWRLPLPTASAFADWWHQLALPATDELDQALTPELDEQMYRRIAGGVPMTALALASVSNEAGCLSLSQRREWVEAWCQLQARRSSVGRMVQLANKMAAELGLAFMLSCVLDLLKLQLGADPSQLRNADVADGLSQLQATGPQQRGLVACYQELLQMWQRVQAGHVLNPELLWERTFLQWMTQASAATK